MKKFLTLLVLSMNTALLQAQTSTTMERKYIKTSIGQIAVFHKQTELNNTPVILLHGVYFDHNLWENQLQTITDRPVYAVDMPLHGESNNNIKKDWTLNDCADMLLEILDSLNLKKVIAVGHSWGSMTILRAANKSPEKFEAVGLCNMPFKEAAAAEKRKIKLQHSGLLFRKLYMKQAGKFLMAVESREKNPELMQKLITPMSKLTSKKIKYTNKAVRIDAKNATHLIINLTVPVIALVGEQDYVGKPPIGETIVVKGAHVSPLEVPDEVNTLIQKICKLVH